MLPARSQSNFWMSKDIRYWEGRLFYKKFFLQKSLHNPSYRKKKVLFIRVRLCHLHLKLSTMRTIQATLFLATYVTTNKFIFIYGYAQQFPFRKEKLQQTQIHTSLNNISVRHSFHSPAIFHIIWSYPRGWFKTFISQFQWLPIFLRRLLQL